MTASASISTSIPGSMSCFTSTIVAAGRIVANASPWSAADRFPVGDPRDVHPRPDHVLQSGTGTRQGGANRRQGLHGLRVGIALADQARRRHGRAAGDKYERPDPHGPGVADDRLPLAAARDVLASWACPPREQTHQIVEGSQDPVRIRGVLGSVRDQPHRHSGCPGGLDIDGHIADIHRLRRRPTAACVPRSPWPGRAWAGPHPRGRGSPESTRQSREGKPVAG